MRTNDSKLITLFSDIPKLILREAKMLIADKSIFMIFLVAPFVYPFAYGAFYMNKAEEKVKFAYCDEDDSPLSRQLIRDISACQTIGISKRIYDYSQVESDLAYNKAHAVIYIPKNFSTNIKRGKSTAVNLILPAGRLLVTSDLGIPSYYMSAAFGAKIAASYTAKKGVPVFNDKSIAQPIGFEMKYLNNPYLTYGDMLMPAIIVIIFAQVMLIGGAAIQAKEFAFNERRDLLNSTNTYLSVILANAVLYLSALTFAGLFVLGLIVPFYDIHIAPNYLDLFLISEISMLTCLVFGMFLGTFFKSKVNVFIVLAFTSYPFFLMTGYAWHWEQLPNVMQYLAKLVPMVPFVQSYQIVTQYGNSIAYAAPQAINILMLLVLYSVLYVIRMHYLKRKTNNQI